jgi:hypothetical protein
VVIEAHDRRIPQERKLSKEKQQYSLFDEST